MQRALFRQGFLRGLTTNPQLSAHLAQVASHTRKTTSKQRFVPVPISVSVPKPPEKKEDPKPTNDKKDDPPATNTTPTKQKPIPTITQMDRDIARRKLQELTALTAKHKVLYVIESIPSDCNEASLVSLRTEQNSFHQLFGETKFEQDALVELIATDFDKDQVTRVLIVDGLIRYFKDLATYIQSNKLKLELKDPKLLQNYIDYGINEVHHLIKSFARKITSPARHLIDSAGILFPTVNKNIANIFATKSRPLQPVEF